MSLVAIRPYALEDAASIAEAVSESIDDLRPWMPWAHPDYAWEESRAWLELQVPAFAARTAFEFAIVSDAGDYLGGCGLNQIDTFNRRANLGYWVRSRATRQGVATRAVELVRAWAFTETNLARLEILAAVGNTASQGVAQKSGARAEGTLRNRLLLHGEFHNAVMYSLTRL